MTDYEKLGLILMLAVSTMLNPSRDYHWFQAFLIVGFLAGLPAQAGMVLFAAGGEEHAD